jgi:tryptophan halogenase
MNTSSNSGSKNNAARPGTGMSRIGIVGNGIAAWMAAAALSEIFSPKICSIFIINNHNDSDGAESIAWSADSTLPSDDNRLQIWRHEDRLLTAANGAFTWGIAYSGWANRNSAWFHPFGSIGANLGPIPFHLIAARLREDGMRLRLADYSLPALAAQAGRFIRPTPDARSVLSTCRYGLHLDTGGLTQMFRAAATAAGVSIQGRLADVEYASDGRIAALKTTEGQRLEGELFLDCTSDGALITRLGAGWEDWSAWLPCNRLLAIRTETTDAPPPWSHSAAHAAGWTRHLSVDGAQILTSFHTPGINSEQAALDSLRALCGDAALANVQPGSLRPGRRNMAWIKNCVALGAAAAMIEPLAVSNLQLLRSGILRLLELLPATAVSEIECREYNRRRALELDNARDFAAALYKTNGRQGEVFWDARRAMSVPSTLDYRIRLYQSLGRVVLYDEEPLENTSWISLFDEQGLQPGRHHPMVHGYATSDLQAHIARTRSIMIEELQKMPLHSEYLNRLKRAVQNRNLAAGSEEAAR